VRISELEGRRVALWGYGREGRAALAALRWRLPRQPLTLFCGRDEAGEALALDDPALTIDTQVSAEKLAAFEFVIKSPGISPYTSPAADAAMLGARFIGGTALWFGEHGADARAICVTGTKGKSTTTAMVAHLLRAGGHRTALAGNIGLPLLELLDPVPPPEYWAIELSSYQTGDALTPEVAVVLNLFPEHLDWHGTEQRYIDDKLALVTRARPKHVVLNATDPRLAHLSLPGAQVHWFNTPTGWHLREQVIYRGGEVVLNTRHLPLPGRHNRINLCAALAAIEAMGLDAVALAPQAASFVPLPHRLQSLGARGGIEYVNDSISTTPYASLAAMDCFKGRPVAILVGGYDRGLDWGVFADRIAHDPPRMVVTLGQNGPRIAERLRPLANNGRFQVAEAQELDEAVELARRALDHQGVLLLSPGAPSFPRYRDYAERGRHFAQVCGFDPDAICAIPGLGIH
jgi:UDP-N-acetylmuramoylalanine--D-glutamate ligase